jgi:S-adenosylmethionine:tRNA ribosyltransferase-isomerase
MQTSDFDYHLPEELIAQSRVHPYDHSKLLVLHKETGEIEDKHFYDIVNYLTDNDVLVFNNTKVFKARLYGKKANGKKIEILLLEPIIDDKFSYKALTKGRVKERDTLSCSETISCTITSIDADGERTIEFSRVANLKEEVTKLAGYALPPYITHPDDPNDYQTTYANPQDAKSVAAPTAGFHFTPELLDKISTMGVQTEYVTLSVGIGTFRPVKTEKIEEHYMHSEHYVIAPEVLERLNRYKKEGRRIIAVGTTSVRTLEDSVNEKGMLTRSTNDTSIFIHPPYTFKFVDAMITNFHLPKSTLMMLISAFATRETIMQAYKHAVDEKYRFFSFGDSMFIL